MVVVEVEDTGVGIECPLQILADLDQFQPLSIERSGSFLDDLDSRSTETVAVAADERVLESALRIDDEEIELLEGRGDDEAVADELFAELFEDDEQQNPES